MHELQDLPAASETRTSPAESRAELPACGREVPFSGASLEVPIDFEAWRRDIRAFAERTRAALDEIRGAVALARMPGFQPHTPGALLDEVFGAVAPAGSPQHDNDLPGQRFPEAREA